MPRCIDAKAQGHHQKNVIRELGELGRVVKIHPLKSDPCPGNELFVKPLLVEGEGAPSWSRGLSYVQLGQKCSSSVGDVVDLERLFFGA